MLQLEVLIFVLLGAPFTVIIASLLVPYVRFAELFNLCGSIVCFVASILMILNVPQSPTVYLTYFYLDHLSVWVLLCTSIVYLLSSIYSIGYMRTYHQGLRLRTFYALFAAFACVMYLAGVMNSLLFYWIGIDLTTIVSAFLVCFKRTPKSVEASWKYLVVVVTGLSLALLGITLFQWGSVMATSSTGGITWVTLKESAPFMNAHLLILAYLLVIVGFCTKVGLAPMHTWLPDAHSEGPAPVSAMLSGALLNTAMLSVVRFMGILSDVGLATIAHVILVILGVLSLIVAGFYIGGQKGVKRLMAYSSLEHMAVIGLGFGFGGIYGFAGAMYHMINHSLNKSLMFFGCGNAMHVYNSHFMNDMRGILKVFPRSGILWLMGAIAITGAPPGGLFLSELMIMRGGLLSPHKWGVFVMMALLILIFCSFIYHFVKMYFSEPSIDLEQRHKLSGWFIVPMVLAVIPLYLFGFWWPHSFWDFFLTAANQLGGLIK